MKNSAKHRGLVWELTDSQVIDLMKKPCFYCGTIEGNTEDGTGKANGAWNYNGLDRVDNTKGYILDNVVSCCPVCNQAKHTMTIENFRAWVTRIYTRWIKYAK
jgi:5-methylcytosine-specific restriction endonuclease McrA